MNVDWAVHDTGLVSVLTRLLSIHVYIYVSSLAKRRERSKKGTIYAKIIYAADSVDVVDKGAASHTEPQLSAQLTAV